MKCGCRLTKSKLSELSVGVDLPFIFLTYFFFRTTVSSSAIKKVFTSEPRCFCSAATQQWVEDILNEYFNFNYSLCVTFSPWEIKGEHLNYLLVLFK